MKRYEVLVRLIQENGFEVGAEVGVNMGVTTQWVLARCRGFRWVAVDDWRLANWGKAQRRRARKSFDQVHRRFNKRIRLLEMDSLQAAKQIDDGSLDLVFIDACHVYAAVKSDIQAWAPKVRKGGILSGHDYGQKQFPGVKRAVDEYCTPNLEDEWVWWTRL